MLKARDVLHVAPVRAAAVAIACALALVAPADAFAERIDDEVAVAFTNDIHCAVDGDAGKTIGYAGVAAFVDDLEEAYGDANVTVVDAGDAIQGGPVGLLTEGEAIVRLMNAVGYDVAVPGNHEFDYGMQRLLGLVERSDATYVSCNFVSLASGETVFSPYTIETYGAAPAAGDADGVLKVAYVGITTPETLSKSSPASFADDAGTYLYGFSEDPTGEALYARVQAAVDAARAAGADYVVAVGHLGRSGITDRWTSDAVIAHTTGIDACIDGHSHEAYVTSVANRDGEQVPLAQTGTKLAAVGELTIDPDDADGIVMSFELVTAADFTRTAPDVQAEVDAVDAELADELDRVVGESTVALVSEDAQTGLYVRLGETNMGDFVADAYRAATGAQIAIVNGGGVRSSIQAGPITNSDLYGVQPFGNELSMVEATGQEILDALEMGVSKYPEASGGFLQVSGLTYAVRTDIPSSVETDDHGAFVRVAGERRVHDVRVGGEPIDPARTYTLASHGYLLLEGGDGMTMFKDCPVLLANAMTDVQGLMAYLADDLSGVVSDAYADPAGSGRIVLTTGEGGVAPEPAPAPDPDLKPAPDLDPEPAPGEGLASAATAPGTTQADEPTVLPEREASGAGSLPQTGDAGFVGVAMAGGLGALCVAGGIVLRVRRRRA